MSNKKRIILSLNGGGTLGYISAKIVERIETSLGKPSYEIFSMISGVSTGSILGSMLAMGHSAGMVSNFYSKEGDRIFGSPRWMPWKAKYNKDVLHGVMKEYMDVPLREMKVPLMYYAVRIDKPYGGVKFWKSWRGGDERLCDTVIASCSAPTYFAPWVYDGGVYIDGGIYTNNPSMNAIAEGLKLGWNLEDIVVVNIAVDSWRGVDKAPTVDGLMEWITRITMTTMGVSQQAVEYHSGALLGDQHYVIQTPRFLKIDSLDFSDMDRIVDETWERCGLQALQTIFRALDS